MRLALIVKNFKEVQGTESLQIFGEFISHLRLASLRQITGGGRGGDLSGARHSRALSFESHQDGF